MTVWVLPSAVMVSPLGKLSLYHVAVKAVFIQYVCSQASETVGRCYALIAHSAHQVRQSVFTHMLVRVFYQWEQITAMSCQFLQFCQKFKRPIGKGETICGAFIFILAAGMLHSVPSKSNSDHSAALSSLFLTRVSMINCMAIFVCCLACFNIKRR